MRSQGRGRTGHARVPSALAELQSGWEMFLQFAREVGAIGLVEKEELEQKGGEALAKMAALQAKISGGQRSGGTLYSPVAGGAGLRVRACGGPAWQAAGRG